MLSELVRAFFLIFAAEMGDKTQIIAMTFATQYTIREVMLGVAIGVFFNHGIAIILGRYLSTLIPMDTLQLVAGIMFVIFGILALKDDEDEEEQEDKKSYGPILTVALAFFIGELGDKTQLTAMSLAAEGGYPVFILMGTILGMLGTSGLGIFVGSKIGDRIPDLYIKIVSSLVFVFFGTVKLYQQLSVEYLTTINIAIYFVIIIGIELFLINKLIVKRRKEKTPIQKAAERLYIHNKVLSNAIDDICLGEGSCGDCQGVDCIIGYTKYIIKNARENNQYYTDEKLNLDNIDNKDFDKSKVTRALGLILKDYKENGYIEDESFIVNKVRYYLELILFNKKIKSSSIEEYLSSIKEIDENIAKTLEIQINH